MKKILLILFFLLICFVAYKCYHWGVNNGFINANKLFVEVKEPLDKYKVKIINEYVEMDSFHNENKLENACFQNTIFKNGSIKGTPNSDDENDFVLIYDNKYYCMFRYLKYDAIMTDNHYFTLFKSGNHIYVHVIILQTKSKVRKKRIELYIKMIPVSKSDHFKFDVTCG